MTIEIGIILSLLGLLGGVFWKVFSLGREIEARLVRIEDRTEQMSRIEDRLDEIHDTLLVRPCMINPTDCEIKKSIKLMK